MTRENCMTTLNKPSLIAASLLLAVAATVAVAQTVPAKPPAKSSGKTLGGKAAAGGKLMTRDELRSCLKRLDDINRITKEIEALRPSLDRERDELKASGEALKTERAELDSQLVTVREWEAKTRTLAADIETFNKRSAAVPDAPRKEQEKLTEELKVERDRLTKERTTLTAEEATLVPAYQNAAKAFNERASARDAKVADWNQRNSAAVDVAQKQEQARALWLDECANRPYLEDDEKAIKAGK
jgi:chromosome segregation ATPase